MRMLALFLCVPLLWSVRIDAQAAVDTASQSPMGDTVPHKERAAKPSATLTVTVPGHPPTPFSVADLLALPQLAVTAVNAHTKAEEHYSGPRVADVLAKAGLTFSETTQHGILDAYVLASGTDGYYVLFSGAELEPGLHKSETIVAVAQDGKPLSRIGAFQLIAPEDAKPARWVRNLQGLAVTPVPAPR